MQLVFATANKNKLSEINAIIPKPFSVIGLSDAGIQEEIPETGTTIKENSLLKARYVADHLKNNSKLIFADDSGLEVEALNGAPGVYSARYAGEPKNDSNNNDKLLKELSSGKNRRARFVTIITLISGDDVHYFEGDVKGIIAEASRGTSGFGYDPLFIPDGYEKTFAELGNEIKNKISHRAIAVKKLIAFLVRKQG